MPKDIVGISCTQFLKAPTLYSNATGVGIKQENPTMNFDTTPDGDVIDSKTYTRPLPAILTVERKALVDMKTGCGVFDKDVDNLSLYRSGGNWRYVENPNNIAVYSTDDLPTPVGDDIFLEDAKQYYFDRSAGIVLSHNLVLGKRTRIYFAGIQTTKKIVFTGTALIEESTITFVSPTGGIFIQSTAAVGANEVIRISRSNLLLGTGQAFDITAGDPSAIFILDNVVVAGQAPYPFDVGDISILGVSFDLVRFYFFTSGLDFINNYVGVNMQRIECKYGQNSTTNMFDFTGNAGLITLNQLACQPNPNEKIFNFNLTSFEAITVSNCPISLQVPGVTLSNLFEIGSLTNKSIGVKFAGCLNISDSAVSAYSYFTGNTTVTTPGNAVTPQKVLTTAWIDKETERIEFKAVGTWKYLGLETKDVNIEANLTLDPTAVTDTVWSAYIFKNGVVVSDSVYTTGIKGGETITVSPKTIETINTSDYLEIFILRVGGTGDVYVTDARFLIK
jgi:hypothetical protein